MRKHVMWMGVVLVLLSVAGMVYAQGDRRSRDKRDRGTPGRPPSMGRMPFGPTPRSVEPPAPAPRPAVPEPSPVIASHPCAGPYAGTAHCPFAGEYGPFWTHHWRLVRAGLFLLVAVPVLVTLFWILPIALGVRVARRRNLSPLWMLFGIHPLGGWIACLVLALCRGKVECPTCGGYVRRNFRQCPFCQSPMEGTKPSRSEK